MTKRIAIVHEFDWLFADDENRGNKAKGVIGSRQYERLEKYLRREAGRGNSFDQMVRFGRREGRNAIQVLNYVGVIRFADGAQIEVLPKIELGVADDDVTRKIFLKMLRALLNFEDKAKVGGRAQVDDSRMRVFDVFVRRFLDDAAELVKRGLKGGYSTVSGNEHFFKGKLNVAENIRQNIAHRERFFVEYDVFSADAPENRLIRTALERLRTEVGDVGCRNDINRLLPVFEEVPRSGNVDADLLAAKAVRASGLYRAVVDWCGVFLMHRGFAAFSGSHDVQTLLFPMEKLFEAYVAHVVRKYANPAGWRVSAQEHGKCLFACQGVDRFILKPDIVLRKGNQIIIADTKWKRLNRDERHAGVSQSDMYQMYAYGKRYAEGGGDRTEYEVRAVHLIYPKREEVGGKDFMADSYMKYSQYQQRNANFLRVINNPFFYKNANAPGRRQVEIATVGGFRFALDRACYIAQPSVLAKELALLNYGCNEPNQVDAVDERLTTEIAEVMDDWGLTPTRS